MDFSYIAELPFSINIKPYSFDIRVNNTSYDLVQSIIIYYIVEYSKICYFHANRFAILWLMPFKHSWFQKLNLHISKNRKGLIKVWELTFLYYNSFINSLYSNMYVADMKTKLLFRNLKKCNNVLVWAFEQFAYAKISTSKNEAVATVLVENILKTRHELTHQ